MGNFMTWELTSGIRQEGLRYVWGPGANQNAEFKLSAGAIGRHHVWPARHDGAGRASKSGEPMSWLGCSTLPRSSFNRPLPALPCSSSLNKAQCWGMSSDSLRPLTFCSNLPNRSRGRPAPIGGSVWSVLI